MRTALLLLLVASCKEKESTAPPPAVSSAPPVASSAPPVASAAPSASVGSGSSSDAHAFNFDKDAVGSAPAGFVPGKTGQGRDGKWIVQAAPDAPSGPNVVAQTDADTTDYRFPVLAADMTPMADVRVSVRCKPVSGKVDQACGITCRYYDANNYYLTRANALENNVRFYRVKDGKREQIASWSGKVSSGEWHTLQLRCQADKFVVHFDGTKAIDTTDKTFMGAGKIGLWTKADSVTYFDDLTYANTANL